MASRDRIIKTAEKYVSKGKIEAAVKEYRKLLDQESDDINTLNRLGDLYARISKVDEAVRLFIRIADRYTDDGFLLKSIAICKKILKLDPSRFDITEKLADLYHRQGLANEARNQYQVLADQYLKNDDSASAIHVHVKMAELEPDNPSHHLKLAELYQKEQLVEKAVGEYRIIGDQMVEHGHTEEARQVYLRALELDPGNLVALGDLVSYLRRSGESELASLLLERATELNPQARALADGELPAPIPEAGEPPSHPDEDEEQAVGFELEIESDQDDEDEEDDGVFVLDLDDDSPPPTQVLPPAELDEEALAFRVDDDAPGDESVEIVLDDLEPPEDIEWTLEIEDEDDGEEVFAEVEVLEEIPELPEELERELEDEDQDEDREPLEEEPEPTADQPPVADLLAEAEVFAKYGLRDKAYERALEILRAEPHNLDAQRMRIRLLMEDGNHDEVLSLATEFESSARQQDQLPAWEELQSSLSQAGYTWAGDAMASRPAPKKKEPDRISRLLDDLVGKIPTAPASAGPPPPPRASTGLDQALADIASEVLDKKAPKVAPKKPVEPVPPSPQPPAQVESAHPVDEIPVEVKPPPVAVPAAPEPEPVVLPPEPRVEEEAVEEGSGVEWLDEEPAVSDVSVAEGESLFDDEDEFFDLAAELEQELSEAEEVPAQAVVTQTEEPSLEEIVEGFKRGVAENLSQEDYDTHYNLGIAYREMGLLDEAIGEFQLAAKDPAYLVDCCSMLGISFLEKGLPELAVKWYRKGIEAPTVTDASLLGLLYDMGLVYLAMDDKESARKTFVEVYGINSHYRDVTSKVEQLGGVS